MTNPTPSGSEAEFVFEPSGEVRLPNDEDARRDAAVEVFKRHARLARPDSNYDADIEYLEYAVIALVEEYAFEAFVGGWQAVDDSESGTEEKYRAAFEEWLDSGALP